MNFRLLSKVFSILLLLLSGSMAFCLAYAYWERDALGGHDAVNAFKHAIEITLGAGVILFICGLKSGKEVLRKEGIAIVGLGWLICSFFGALPYYHCEPHLSLTQGWFESMSGFTTTGATVIRDLDRFPRSILLWRSLTQWLGGLGILVLFVAVLSSMGVGSKSLFRHESSALSGEGLQARVSNIASMLWRIYIGLSALCCLGLMSMGLSFYDAILHTFSTVSTGGFSSYNNSVAAFDHVWIELWLCAFMILGSINFILYAWLFRKRWERWSQDEETKVFLLLILFSTSLIALNLYAAKVETSISEAFRSSLFQVVSLMTTTGFATRDFAQWPAFAMVLLLLLMICGGCAGSTAGGVKVGRCLFFFKIARRELVVSFRPNQVFSLKLNGSVPHESLPGQTLFLLSIAALTIGLGSGIVAFLEPRLDLVSAFSAVLACLFNIGPGLGAVGPAENFSHLSPLTLLFLGFFMLLGRLEFFAVLVLFIPALWRKF